MDETKAPVPPPRERARFVAAAVAASKQELMFVVGGVMALRDLGLLPYVRVFSGVGLGNLVWAQLCLARYEAMTQGDYRVNTDDPRELHEALWRRVLESPQDPHALDPDDPYDLLRHRFLVPLLNFAEENQEYALMWRRLRHPRGWCRLWDPFTYELAGWLRDQGRWHDAFRHAQVLPVDLGGRHETPHEKEARHARARDHHACTSLRAVRPVVLYHASWQARHHQPLCVTTDPDAPSFRGLHTRFVPPRGVPDFAAVLAASLAPHDTYGQHAVSLKLHASPSEYEVGDALPDDPLGWVGCQTYFIKEKLGRLPSSLAYRDLQGAAEAHPSRKLLLLDGYTEGPHFATRLSAGLQTTCREQHSRLCAAPDVKQEQMLLFARQAVCRYPQGIYGPGADALLPPDQEEPVEEEEDSWAEACRGSPYTDGALVAGDPTLLRHMANLGYLRTVHAYGTPEQHRAWCEAPGRLLCPEVGDPHGWFRQVFGVDVACPVVPEDECPPTAPDAPGRPLIPATV